MKEPKNYALGESEYRFACLIWANEPLRSGELARLAAEQLGWKKSTSYTVLKKLIERGLFCSEGAEITSLVPQYQVQRYESDAVVERTFSGSLPQFVAAFLGGHTLSAQDAAEIRRLLDSAEQKKGGPGC